MGTACSRSTTTCREQHPSKTDDVESHPLPTGSSVAAMGTTTSLSRPATAYGEPHHSVGKTSGANLLCLDAFAVALQQTRKGKHWYVSTLQLQLASLPLCRACRSVPSLHARVDDNTPRTLWAPREENHHHHNHPHEPNKASGCCSRAISFLRAAPSRVPAVQAVCLTWKLPARVLMESGTMDRWGALDDLRLEGDWCWSDLGSGSLQPGGMMSGTRSKTPSQRDVKWPPNLRHLSLGRDVSQKPNAGRRWPHAFRSVEASTDELITGVVWPVTMERLSFGSGFNQSIAGIEWPASLKQLLFGPDFDQPISDVIWPECVQQLSFGGFNQPIRGVMWPVSLHQLSFKREFNQPVGGIVWPSFLRQLSFGESFDQPLDGVVWPASLRHLMLGKAFDHPIDGIEWPDSLQHMSFGPRFNQPISEVVWPIFLEKLDFGRRFNQPIARVVWPGPLQHLSFGNTFNQPVAGVGWPASLRRLSFGRQFDQPITGIVWPIGLESVTRDGVSLLTDDD